MAGNEGSCFKKLLVGCGCASGALLIGGLALAIAVSTAKPKTPVFGTHSDSHTFESSELEGLVLPELPGEAKPVVLHLDTSLANLRIIPSAAGGEIKLTAEYDTANFELHTQVIPSDERVTYDVSFKSKGGFFSFLHDDNSNQTENTITLQVPRDLAISIQMDFSLGECEMDLSGIPVIALDLDFSMSKAEIRSEVINAVPAETVALSTSMSEVSWSGFDNLRVREAQLELSMGEILIALKTLLEHDLDIQLEASMGAIIFHVPPQQAVESDVELSMGEYHGPRAALESESGYRLRLHGEVSMGNLEVQRK